MITRMKKLQCLVYHRDYDTFLEQLRALGAVHVVADDLNDEAHAELKERLAQLQRTERIASQLQLMAPAATPETDEAIAKGNAEAGRKAVDRVEYINARLTELTAAGKRAREYVTALKPWGDFDPSCLEVITGTGRTVRFYAAARKTSDPEWFASGNALLINEVGKSLYFISIDPADQPSRYACAAEVDLPQVSLSEASKSLSDIETEQKALESELQEIAAGSQADIAALRHEQEAQSAFRHAQLGTERAADDCLMVMTGWIPAKKEDEAVRTLEGTHAWYQISMPQPGDVIPTEMKNGRIMRLYESITRMYGTPDYEEFDSTPMIAIFFSIFFGLCVGDAGYGLVLLFFGFPICKFMARGLQIYINPVLVTVLGFVSTVVGLILGTGFGVNLAEVDAAWINWMHPYMVTGQIPGTTYDWQMALALGIGVLHLCIAMTVKALSMTIRYGFRHALTSWVWLISIVGVVVASGLMLTTIDPDIIKYSLMGIGIFCFIGIYLIGEPGGNPLLKPFAGLYATYNMATGLLGDILSYIRLYALGLAGGMLGSVFNQLAGQVIDGGEGSNGTIMTLCVLGGVLIIVLGHTLNMALSCLSAFVHPLRLNFVEYFKNAGYNGKGIAYQPLKS